MVECKSCSQKLLVKIGQNVLHSMLRYMHKTYLDPLALK